MRKRFVFIGVLAALQSAPVAADQLRIDDLLGGKWCGEVTDYTFTRERLVVTPKERQKLTFGTKLTIDKTEPVEDGGLRVDWHSPATKETSTTFTLSSDRRQLFQKQEKNVQARTFKRC